MKKIFLAALVGISLVALAASPDRKQSTSNSSSFSSFQDTIPGKKDTGKKRPPVPDTLRQPVPDSPPSVRPVILQNK